MVIKGKYEWDGAGSATTVCACLERASEMHQGGGVCTTAITEEGFANSCACADVFFLCQLFFLINHILILFKTDIYWEIGMSRTKTAPLLMNIPEESSELINITNPKY